MPENTNHEDDRSPTSGPETERYDRYRSVITDDDEVMIYDVDIGAAWIQSKYAVQLADWV